MARVVWHRYANGQTFCGGQWYTTGAAPCEVRERENMASLNNLPECERADVLAAAVLIGGSPCSFKGSASWATLPDDQVRYPYRRVSDGVVVGA